MIQSSSAGHAKAYFREALAKSDYFITDQELAGTFRGRLSKRLGIEGVATKEQFEALCDNIDLTTGKPLTPRTKKDRTVGYDISFHVPKSVSILHALSNDDHVMNALRASVIKTMEDIEAEARTRVRKNGKSEDRVTGELIYVDFLHQTARAVEGHAPDPHLHVHCYAFNLTWDDTENRVKACQFREINKQMPYFETLFQKRLADQLIARGYQIRPTGKSFEIEGIPQNVIELFSKRTDQIGRVAKEKGITDAKELADLGARTRSKKDYGLSMQDLRNDWRRQINELPPEGKGKDVNISEPEDQPVRYARPSQRSLEQRAIKVDQCVDYAIAHCFVRASVIPMRQLAQTAVNYGMGSAVTPEAMMAALKEHPSLITVKEGDKTLCTTREVLQEEQRMVGLAQAGKGRFTPLYAALPPIKAQGQQGEAIRHVLTTPDMISIIRGAAGAGKTTLMREAVPLLEKTGKTVTIVAPSVNASRGHLRDEGFENAETVALFLKSQKMQEQIKDQVLWVDEAGMLGTKDMAALLDVATQMNARVILGGDTRQHASVMRGDALRILSTVADIRTAEVNKIYRQRDVEYRKAVADLAKGDISAGFAKLESIGAIMETGTALKLAEDYVAALKSGKDVLAISPTHSVGELVTTQIRANLKEAGLIGKREVTVQKLKNLNLTEAQKTDWRNFKEGQFVQFHQNRKGIGRGSLWQVASATEKEVTIKDKTNKALPLGLTNTDDFDIYTASEIALAKGDKVQITKNGWDTENKRLNNGQVFDVMAVKKDGITIGNGRATYKIKPDFGHLKHAHCLTSHASQGRTVDMVFVAQPSATFRATNAKQFYVSVSRARESVSIYTDDKELLMEQAMEGGDRQGAMELVKGNDIHLEHVRQMQRDAYLPHEIGPDKQRQSEITPSIDHSNYYEDYEPGI